MSSAEPTIGIVTWDFLHAKGGMGRSMQWMADALSEDAHIIIGAPSTGLLSFTKYVGGHLLFSLCLPFVLHRWIREHQINLLIVPGGPGGVFLIRKPKIPYISSVYHVYEQQARLVPGQWWKKVFVPFEKWTYRRAKAIMTFNDDTRMILGKIYKVPRGRILSLPHAVALEWKQSSAIRKKKGFCVCVARLEERKGVELLLEAWPMVTEKRADAQLLIIGQGILARKYDERIKHLHNTSRIPALLFADLISVVKQAEVAVCPAYLEGFGLAAAEAMTAGTAVVAADSEGLRCLIEDEKTGLLFASGDSNQLAQKILRTLDDEKERTAIINNAKTAAEQFDWKSASQILRHTVKERMTDAL